MDVLPPSDQPVLLQWLVDTRALWPEATQTRQLSTMASRALDALLSDEERAGVLKYFHVRDAKMALASQLLKHLVVARCAPGVPWRQTALARDARGKPVYRDPATGRQLVVFNVSHQAGIVVLVAVYGGGGEAPSSPEAFQVGIDVVSPSERRSRDRKMIAEAGAGGWPHFVDIHADVLAPGEVRYLKHGLPPPSSSSSTSADDDDHRLRHFYGLWCLREAYVKMTGEALLADWLADLEFRQFRVPAAVAPSETGDDLAQHDPAVDQHDIRFRGAPVGGDVRVRLRSLGADYMVCTAVRSPARREAALALADAAAEEAPFEVLRMEDIVAFAERSRGGERS